MAGHYMSPSLASGRTGTSALDSCYLLGNNGSLQSMNCAVTTAPERLWMLSKNLIHMLDHHRDGSGAAKEVEHNSLGPVADHSLGAHEEESPNSRLLRDTAMKTQAAHIETGPQLSLEGNLYFQLGLEFSHHT